MNDEILLNIGCGSNFHNDWINIDISPRDKRVQKVNILNGLPYKDSSIFFGYSSHVLEHLSKRDAFSFINESKRVLRPGGILRLAVPDLERITRDYLHSLDLIRGGAEDKSKEYDWIMLELIDQISRNKSGGEMIDYLAEADFLTANMIIDRIGSEALPHLSNFKSGNSNVGILKKIKNNLGKVKSYLASTVIYLIAGNKARKSFLLGEFRSSGEVHQWMYDEYSLGRVLSEAGFIEVRKFDPGESYFPGFRAYNLEIKDGHELKPDSIYIEGIKP